MKKLTYDYVKGQIEKEGYKLLSKSYIDSHNKIKLKCPKSHKYKVSWNDFQQGVRCPICKGINASNRSKLGLLYIKEEVKRMTKGQYECLSLNYINNVTKLEFKCFKGHIFNMIWNSFQQGQRCPICYNESDERLESLRKGRKTILKNAKFYCKNNLPTFDTYAPQLEWCEEVRRNMKNIDLLEVRCFKCNEWFIPGLKIINSRIQSLKGSKNVRGEHNFYCSDKCKHSCSVYGKAPEILMKEDAIRAGRLGWLKLDREVQPELRKLVLERDGYKCVKCGSKNNLHCHHIYPVSTNPLESADIDNCIILCYTCHKLVHQKDGCRYGQLKIEVC